MGEVIDTANYSTSFSDLCAISCKTRATRLFLPFAFLCILARDFLYASTSVCSMKCLAAIRNVFFNNRAEERVVLDRKPLRKIRSVFL